MTTEKSLRAQTPRKIKVKETSGGHAVQLACKLDRIAQNSA